MGRGLVKDRAYEFIESLREALDATKRVEGFRSRVLTLAGKNVEVELKLIETLPGVFDLVDVVFEIFKVPKHYLWDEEEEYAIWFPALRKGRKVYVEVFGNRVVIVEDRNRVELLDKWFSEDCGKCSPVISIDDFDKVNKEGEY